MPPPPRTLVIRTSALGDVLLAIPALRALARRGPVELLTAPPLVPLLGLLPELAATHAADAPALTLARRLRPRGFDLVVDLQNKPRTAALASLLGARRVLRHRKRAARDLFARVLRPGPAAAFYQRRLPELGLAPDLDPPLLPAPPPPAGWSRAPGAPPRVGLQLGGRHAIKGLPAARVGQLAAALAREGAEPVFIAGPADPVPDGARHTAALDPLGLAGALATLDAALCFDSGPGHLCAALGVPLVSLFGPTDPARWAPGGPGRVTLIHQPPPCAPCTDHGGERCPLGHHRCLADIDDAALLTALRALLEARWCA